MSLTVVIPLQVDLTEQVVPKDFKIEMSVKERLHLYSLILEEVGTSKLPSFDISFKARNATQWNMAHP